MSCSNEACKQSRAQSEQLFGQLESQFNDLHETHKSVIDEKGRLLGTVKELREAIDAQKSEAIKSLRRAEEAEQQSHRSELALKREKEESESARNQIDQRQRDLDRVQTDVKTLADRLGEAAKREASLSAELSSVRSSMVQLQLNSERLAEEKTLWVKQKTWLEGELEVRSSALLAARKDASAKEVELVSQLDRARQDAVAHERRAKEALDELGSTRQRLNEASLKLQTSETAALRKQDGLSRELASLSKLCALHEENAASATKRVAELEAHSSALQIEAESALKRSSDEALKALADTRSEHERIVAGLKTEVKTIQDQLLSERKAVHERAGPAAQVLAALENDASVGGAATSTALELLSRASKQGGSANDLTATAMYSRVVVAEAALSKEKDESNKLRTYLGQILHEIESKAPLIAQQRRDYERALIAHEELSRRLAATSRDAAQATADLGAEKDAKSRADALVASLQGEVVDLKKQVLTLVRSSKNSLNPSTSDAFTLDDLSSGAALVTTTKTAAARNGWPATDTQLLQLAAQDDPAARDKLSEAAASAIIDESLLTFSDVKEMQERNQQLIRVLRLLARQLGKLSSSSSGSLLDASFSGSTSASNSSSSSGMILGASGFGGSGIGFGPAGSSAREALVALHNELSELRASRERQAAMVATVAQQRDMYRMLLSQADASLLAKGDASVSGGGGSNKVGSGTSLAPQQALLLASTPNGGSGPSSGASETTGAALGLSQLTTHSSMVQDNNASRLSASTAAVSALAQSTADNLQAMLDEARGELERTRSDARSAIKAAEARTEQLRNECVELNKTMIAAQGEARFQTERATQLQHSADASKEEASRELKRSLHLQDLVVRHQRELADREAALSHARDDLLALRTSIAHSNAERDIALASEARLSGALKEAVQERDRQMHLADELRYFKNEVNARETAERAERADERATLQREWMSARQLLEEERVLSQQRAQQHTLDLKERVQKVDELNQELAKARLDAQAAQSEASAARAQVSSLSEQLSALHSRLEGRLSQLGARGDVDVSRLSQLEITVTALESELTSAKTALETKERHVTEYKAIAEAAEDAAHIMRESQGKAVAAVKAETTKALEELSTVKAAATAAAETLDKVRADAVAASGEWFKKEDLLKAQILSLSGELKTAVDKALTFSEHEAQLKADMKRIDEARERAQANYDMQLQMHAADGRLLKELQEKNRAFEESTSKARDDAARSQAALLTAEQLWAAKESALVSSQSELKASLDTLKEQNALLHSSLTALGVELDKVRSSTTLSATNSSDCSYSSLSAAASNEDIEALRASASQLREVVAYLRRQNEVLESKKELAEQRLHNLEEIAEQKQKTLDETRAYGKRLQEQLSAIQGAPIEGITLASSGSPVSSPGGIVSNNSSSVGVSVRVLTLDEHQRLLEKVSQVALLFESNKLLREENERAAASKQEAEKRSAEFAATLGPLQAAQRSFSSEKQAWESERAMLKEESTLWKTRLEGVFAARDAVDPATHRALVVQLEALQAKSAEQVTKLSSAISAATEAQKVADEYKASLDAKAAELTTKALEVETLTKDLEARQKEMEVKTREIESLESVKTQLRAATISWKKKFEEASQKLKDAAPAAPSTASSSSVSVTASASPLSSTQVPTLTTADNSAAIAVAVAAAKEALATQHLNAMKTLRDEHAKQLDTAKQSVAAAQQALTDAQARFDAEKTRIETHFSSELASARSALVESDAKKEKAMEAFKKVKTAYDKVTTELKKKKLEEESITAATAIQSQSASAAASAFAAATTAILAPPFSSTATTKTSAPSAMSDADAVIPSSSGSTNNATSAMSGAADLFTSNTSPQLPFRPIIGGGTSSNDFGLTFGGTAPNLPVVSASDSFVPKSGLSFPASNSPTLFGSSSSIPVFGGGSNASSSTLTFGTSSSQLISIGSMASSSSLPAASVIPVATSPLNPLATPFVPPTEPQPSTVTTQIAQVVPTSSRKQKPQKAAKKADQQVEAAVQLDTATTGASVNTTSTPISLSADDLMKKRAARFAASAASAAGASVKGESSSTGTISIETAVAAAVAGGEGVKVAPEIVTNVFVSSVSSQKSSRVKRKLEEPTTIQSQTPIQSSATVNLGSSLLVQPDAMLDDTTGARDDTVENKHSVSETTHIITDIVKEQVQVEERGASSRKIARRDPPMNTATEVMSSLTTDAVSTAAHVTLPNTEKDHSNEEMLGKDRILAEPSQEDAFAENIVSLDADQGEVIGLEENNAGQIDEYEENNEEEEDDNEEEEDEEEEEEEE